MKKLISAILCAVMIAAMCSVSLSASAAGVDIKPLSAKPELQSTSAKSDMAVTAAMPEVAEIMEKAELAQTSELAEYGDYEYFIEDDERAVIMAYNGSESNIIVPSKIEDYTITGIADYAFYGNDSIRKVVIPYSVLYVGEYAFCDCINLKTVKFGIGLTTISRYAFSGCTSLSELSFPDSLIYVGEEAFEGTAWLNGMGSGVVYAGRVVYKYNGTSGYNIAITIKEGTKAIAPNAFYDCYGITRLSLPSTLQIIGECSFMGCSISSVSIPASVIYIGCGAFAWCVNLKTVTMPDTVSIGGMAFYETPWLNNKPDGLVYINNQLYCYKGTAAKNTKITVKDGTTAICDAAFDGQEGITSVVLCDSVETIGEYAFKGCKNLETVKLSDQLTMICSCAFWDCVKLKSISIPKSVFYIGNFAFDGCTSLSSVDIVESDADESFLSIDSCAFTNCTNLKSVTIPANVSYMGMYSMGYTYVVNDEDEYVYSKMDDFVITGYNGTAAQLYAEENDFKFESLGDIIVSDYVLGDVDGDGEVSIMDATTIQMQLAKLYVGVYIEAAADTDEDGEISIMDATYIQMHLAKLVTDSNIGKYMN